MAYTLQLITGQWTSHSAQIDSLTWTADGKHIASGSLDTHIYIWSTDNPSRNIALKNVVPSSVIKELGEVGKIRGLELLKILKETDVVGVIVGVELLNVIKD